MNETNIFPIKNLADLNCNYKLYKITGLLESSDEFNKNKEQLVRKLSFSSKSPCAFVKKENEFFIAQPEGFDNLPDFVKLIRCQVKLELRLQIQQLKFDNLTDDDIHIAIRFLTFSISDPLFSDQELWQPGPGKAFFYKKPDQDFNEYSFKGSLHRGFLFRIISLPNHGLGICIDMTSKYVSKDYLPSKLTEEGFQKLKGKNCIYEFGDRWYEINITGLEGLPAKDFKLDDGSYLSDYAKKRIRTNTKQFDLLDENGSVVAYFNNSSRSSYALSSLCKLTVDTNHPSIKRLHYKTQLSPKLRNQEILKIVDKFFSNLKFGNSYIVLDNPLTTSQSFHLPDLKFGNDVILSSSNTPNAVYCSVKEFGQMKLRQLTSSSAGFIEQKKQLQDQLFVLPKSLAESSGHIFLKELQEQFTELYGKSTGIQYSPQIITYNDHVPPTIPKLGKEILKPIEDDFFRYGGFALVVIPRLGNAYKEDKLANLVYKEMRKRDIHCSIIHDQMIKRSYVKFRTDDGGFSWGRKRDSRLQSKLRGYLFNVVLTKILLLNSCWPFMIESGLESDLTIGIDVKNHTAGFTYFYGDGTPPNFYASTTRENEKLSSEHIESQIVKHVREEQRLLGKTIKKITIHRDGRLFSEEQSGILEAFQNLANEDLVSKDYDVNIIEVPKNSIIPIRFFNKKFDSVSKSEFVSNPLVGTYVTLEKNAYIATTGYPYRFLGSSHPVHIIHKYGSMSIDKICRDFFYLSNLTWTKIDGCIRVPITLKLTDIRLREEAGDYEEDKFRFEQVLVDHNE